MLRTQVYRGKRIELKSVVVTEKKTSSYYPLKRFCFTDFQIVDDDSNQTLLSFPELALGSRSGRWDSWTAWDSCGFFGLLGDFILYYVTDKVMMDPSDAKYDLKTVYLVDPARLESNADDITASMLLLHNFEDDEEKEIDLGNEFISLNHWTMHTTTGSGWAVMQELLEGEVAFETTQFSACGGAALVKVNGQYRWLAPHADGPAAALARILATEPAGDWLEVIPCLEGASSVERDRVRDHFLALDNVELSATVTEALGAPEQPGE